MYIETTPDIEYTKLPATLLDGNNPIDYGILDSLQLRYLDGNYEPVMGSHEFTVTVDTEQLVYYDKNKLQINYQIPNHSVLAVLYKDGIDITKGVYLDGNTQLFNAPINFYVETADGNNDPVDGHLPSSSVYVTIRDIDDRLIDLSSVRDLGLSSSYASIVYYADRIETYKESDGGWNSLQKPIFNIFVYDGIMEAYYGPANEELKHEVILHSNLIGKQTIMPPSVNIALSSVNRSHNLPHARPALLAPKPAYSEEAVYGSVYWASSYEAVINLNGVNIDTNVDSCRCEDANGSKTIVGYYYPKYNEKWYYSLEVESFIGQDIDLIIVARLPGTHVEDIVNGGYVPLEAAGPVYYDDGPLPHDYSFRITYPELIGLPVALGSIIRLPNMEERLKGVVNINNEAWWCNLLFEYNYETYSIYTVEPYLYIPLHEIASVRNKEISVVKDFNKKLVVGSLDPQVIGQSFYSLP